MPDSSHQQRAIASLARETQLPVDEVARLYAGVRAELEARARVRTFIDILATRRVRARLRAITEAAGRTPS